MSNSWYPNQAPQQQWNAQAGFNQQQGWVQGGGQWQPMQQAHQLAQFPGQPQQFPGQPQQFQGQGQLPQFSRAGQLPGGQQFPGHSQQFQGQPQQFPGQGQFFQGQMSHHGVQGVPFQGAPQQQRFPAQPQHQHQQQQQVSYMQEQQRRAKEEQKRREMEIQKRKLRNVNVSNPTAGSLSFDELISIPGGSSSSKESPGPSRSASGTPPVPVSKTVDPLPEQAVPPPASSETHTGIVDTQPPVSKSQNATKDSRQASGGAATFDQLMMSSLSNLNDPSPSTKKRVVFKTTPTTRHLPSNSSPKTFSQSTKARSWSANQSNFSGVFTQHAPQAEQDDSFGDFQSVGVGNVPPQQDPGFQNTVQGSQPLSHAPVQNFPPQAQLLQGPSYPQQLSNSSVTFTSTHLHPLPSTSTSGTPSAVYSSPSSGLPIVTPKGQFTGLDISKFPPLYREVYQRCAKANEPYVSTELLFPILTSSELPKNMLRDLWTVANRKVPGKLDQMELFVLLGLIGLAQSGVGSPTPEDLKRAPAPPVPKLAAIPEVTPNAQNVTPQLLQSTTPNADEFGGFQQHQPVQPPAPLANTQSLPPPIQGQPSLLSPAVPSPMPSGTVADSKPPTSDKYSAFADIQVPGLNKPEISSQIITTSSPSVTTYASPPDGGDKYGAFSELQSATVSGSQVGMMKKLPDGQSSGGQTPLASVTAPPDFGSFMQAPSLPPMSSTITVKPVEENFASFDNSTTKLPITSSADLTCIAGPLQTSDQKWADFAQFPGTQSSMDGKPKTTTSAFDSIILPELSSSIKAIPSATEEEHTTAGSLSVSAAPLTPKSEQKLKKQLTGFDVLEEEFSARVVASSTDLEKQDFQVPLVPESVPLDEFGDFEAYSSPTHTTTKDSFSPKDSSPSLRTKPKQKAEEFVDPCVIWKKCLCKCAEVLETCVQVFSGVEEQNVLSEITNSEEGRNKLRGIAELYRLARRIYSCLKEKGKAAESEDSVVSIQKQWRILGETLPDNVMEQLYVETARPHVEEDDVLSNTISKCYLCLMGKNISISAFLSFDGKREKYHVPMLFHQGQSYHPTCANFWINVVKEELPVLN